MLNQHQYCMLWCPADQFTNTDVPHGNFYRDLTVTQASRLGSYYRTEHRDILQDETMKKLDIVCCQIATRESFEVVQDSRYGENLGRDVTLVTFGSFDRIDALYEMKRRWQGPLVLVLYMADYNDALFEKLNDSEHLTSDQVLKGLERLPFFENTVILLYKATMDLDKSVLRIGYNAKYYSLDTMSLSQLETVVPFEPEEAAKRNLALMVDFPINSLRNIAQDYAETRYVLPLDLDFIPDLSAYEFLKRQAQELVGARAKIGIVLPHFEKITRCDWIDRPYEYPLDFFSFSEQFKAGLVQPFHVSLKDWENLGYYHWLEEDLQDTTCKAIDNLGYSWIPGTNLTDYPKWFELSWKSGSPAVYEIPQICSFNDMLSYEPFIMLDRVANSTHLLMRYNEVFTNRQKNKTSWIAGLRMSGYRLFVGVRHFLIHQEHPHNAWIDVMSSSSDNVKAGTVWDDTRMITAARAYLQTLRKVYEGESKI
jgi:hypothetical protein